MDERACSGAQDTKSGSWVRVTAIMALLCGVASLAWQASMQMAPRTLFATRLSLQTGTQSTRMSLLLQNDAPTALLFMPRGEIVEISCASSEQSPPGLLLRRADTRGSGVLRIMFPPDAPPYLEQASANGETVWSMRSKAP